MPTLNQLFIVCVVSIVASVTMVLLFHLIGYGEHAVIAAAVSASSASVVALRQLRGAESEPETQNPDQKS